MILTEKDFNHYSHDKDGLYKHNDGKLVSDEDVIIEGNGRVLSFYSVDIKGSLTIKNCSIFVNDLSVTEDLIGDEGCHFISVYKNLNVNKKIDVKYYIVHYYENIKIGELVNGFLSNEGIVDDNLLTDLRIFFNKTQIKIDCVIKNNECWDYYFSNEYSNNSDNNVYVYDIYDIENYLELERGTELYDNLKKDYEFIRNIQKEFFNL